MDSLKTIRLFFSEMGNILIHGDMRFSGVMLGLSLIMWGVLAGILYPADIFIFSSDFPFQGRQFWLLNYIFIGIAWIWVSVKNFPHPPSLMLGAWCTMLWTFVQVARATSSYSSGMTLNFVVIAMGLLLVYRSGKNEH